jgi:tRNA(His) 5'-end guanylyltransferase
MPTSPCRKAYDHRLRDITCEESDSTLFRDLGVPRSTAASWIRRGQCLSESKGVFPVRA